MILYIHDNRFADETKKSELINKLLASHYTVDEVYESLDKAVETSDVYKCKNGHRSLDGKHCFNAKCVYGQ